MITMAARLCAGFKHNGTLIHTDSSGVSVLQQIGAQGGSGDLIGDVFWEVTYSGCTPDYLVQSVGQSGGSTTQSEPDFDVLKWQVFDIPEEVLEADVFS